jgi:hypothetical protein
MFTQALLLAFGRKFATHRRKSVSLRRPESRKCMYNELIQGNIEELIPSLSLDKMSDYFTQLKDITTPNNSTIVGFYTKILYSIYVSGGIKQSEMDATNLASIYKSDSETLRNPQKLKQYLDELNTRNYLFDPITIVPSLLKIKQEYLIYNQTYGIPTNFTYDFDKLNEIINSLK